MAIATPLFGFYTYFSKKLSSLFSDNKNLELSLALRASFVLRTIFALRALFIVAES
jgi:hypothetical protein